MRNVWILHITVWDAGYEVKSEELLEVNHDDTYESRYIDESVNYCY
jgi:deoxycytidine triphosphate deaminase